MGSSIKFCPQCGKPVTEGFKFCPECGCSFEVLNTNEQSGATTENGNSIETDRYIPPYERFDNIDKQMKQAQVDIFEEEKKTRGWFLFSGAILGIVFAFLGTELFTAVPIIGGILFIILKLITRSFGSVKAPKFFSNLLWSCLGIFVAGMLISILIMIA